MNRYTQCHRTIWSSPWGIAELLVLMLLAAYLLTAHTVHVFAVLPLAVFLLSPLMHLFMMRGMHSGHDSMGDKSSDGNR